MSLTTSEQLESFTIALTSDARKLADCHVTLFADDKRLSSAFGESRC